MHPKSRPRRTGSILTALPQPPHAAPRGHRRLAFPHFLQTGPKLDNAVVSPYKNQQSTCGKTPWESRFPEVPHSRTFPALQNITQTGGPEDHPKHYPNVVPDGEEQALTPLWSGDPRDALEADAEILEDIRNLAELQESMENLRQQMHENGLETECLVNGFNTARDQYLSTTLVQGPMENL